MQRTLRLILVDADPDRRAAFKSMVVGLDSMWIEADCARYHEGLDLFAELRPDVVVVCLDEDRDLALDLIRELRSQSPDVQIFALSESEQSHDILQAMRAGANEYLTLPFALDDFLQAIERARQLLARERGDNPDLSKVIAFAGASGGVGCTTIATNLGVLLAQDNRFRVLLLDFDMVLGDADIHLDIVHDYTLYDVVENIANLDFSLLKRAIVTHSSGLEFLPHPSTAAEAAAVRVDDVKRLLGLLRSTHTHVIVDLSKRLDAIDRAVLRVADKVVVVAQLNVACVRNVTRLLTVLEQEEQQDILLLFNRVGSREAMYPMEKIEELIGRKADLLIPNDWNSFAAAHDAGIPAVLHDPESRPVEAIRELARMLEPRLLVPGKEGRRTSWLAGLFRRGT